MWRTFEVPATFKSPSQHLMLHFHKLKSLFNTNVVTDQNFFRITRHNTSLSRFRCRFSLFCNICSTQQLFRETARTSCRFLLSRHCFRYDADATGRQNFTRKLQFSWCYTRSGWIRSEWNRGIHYVTTSQMALCRGKEGRRRSIPSGRILKLLFFSKSK